MPGKKKRERDAARARDYYNGINMDNHTLFMEMRLHYIFREDFPVELHDALSNSELFQRWKMRYLTEVVYKAAALDEEFSAVEVREAASVAIISEAVRERNEHDCVTSLVQEAEVTITVEQGATITSPIEILEPKFITKSGKIEERRRSRRQNWRNVKSYEQLKFECVVKAEKEGDDVCVFDDVGPVAAYEKNRSKRSITIKLASPHSKFCKVGSFINELVSDHDPRYKKLLLLHANVTQCPCLAYFRQSVPKHGYSFYHFGKDAVEASKSYPSLKAPSIEYDPSQYRTQSYDFWIRMILAKELKLERHLIPPFTRHTVRACAYVKSSVGGKNGRCEYGQAERYDPG